MNLQGSVVHHSFHNVLLIQAGETPCFDSLKHFVLVFWLQEDGFERFSLLVFEGPKAASIPPCRAHVARCSRSCTSMSP